MKFAYLMIISLLMSAAAVHAQEAPSVESQFLYPVEIQMFMNYRGYNDYDHKFVSFPERPFSATLLDPTKTPEQNAACFKGDAYDALRLWKVMVHMMNFETYDDVRPYGEVYFDPDSNKLALRLEGVDAYGMPFVWFERMRECDRWSTPEERANF